MANDYCYVDGFGGEDYDYADKIKEPIEMGVSPGGDALSKNIDTMAEYTNVLISGRSKAHRGLLEGKPLGNRYFIKTNEKCKIEGGKEENRSLYIDTIPEDIKMGIGSMGTNIPDTKGLVPGLYGDIQKIVPKDLLGMTNDTSCVELNLHVRRNDNTLNSDKKGKGCKGYITMDEAKLINPCAFPKINGIYTNPYKIRNNSKSPEQCPEREGFITANKNLSNDKSYKNEKHINSNIENLYILGVGGLFIYLLYKVCNKN